jgi:hypothetical protein
MIRILGHLRGLVAYLALCVAMGATSFVLLEDRTRLPGSVLTRPAFRPRREPYPRAS